VHDLDGQTVVGVRALEGGADLRLVADEGDAEATRHLTAGEHGALGTTEGPWSPPMASMPI